MTNPLYSMPFRRRFGGFRRRFRRKGFGQSYGPPMRRPRWTRRRRVAQNLTRDCRWFKSVDTIVSQTPQGWLRYQLKPIQASVLASQPFEKIATIWEEYKVLKIITKFYPANIGGESLTSQDGAQPNPNSLIPTFARGNVVTWVDPQGDDGPVTNIISVMAKASARIIQPRRFHKRYLNRPRSGYPTWGRLTTAAVGQPGSIQTLDTWQPAIRLFGENFQPPNTPPGSGSPIFYYVEVLYKILFRSRQES